MVSGRELMAQPIDATPSKRIYLSIINDYSLETAICELIDNAIDVWTITTGGPDLLIGVDIDLDQQKISIRDNAGGVKESELKKLISPGESTITGGDATIGIFGVGSKRAVVALAQLVRITTRYHKEKTCRVEYDDDWLKDPDWNLYYSQVPDIAPSTTEIMLSNLRFKVEEKKLNELREHLSATYAYFLQEGKISIVVNDVPIVAKFFDNWAFPPNLVPTQFPKKLSAKKFDKKIKFDMIAGLTIEKGKTEDYGVYFYCNRRLISRALRSPEVGFISGLAGRPDNRMSLARIIIRLDGPSNHMPWTSNKTGINYNHLIFQAISNDIIQAVKVYAKSSRKLYPHFEEKVLPYKTGQIDIQKLDTDEPIKPSKLPDIPSSGRPDYKRTIFELNDELSEKKPWIRGLYEALVAESVIVKQKNLTQRNRISLIILDSTLEIAFKNYLAFELDPPIGDSRLDNLFNNRIDVHKEVEKHLLSGHSVWQSINYFYKLRCDLIHRKADVLISNEDVNSLRKIVVMVLSDAFSIEFPEEFPIVT